MKHFALFAAFLLVACERPKNAEDVNHLQNPQVVEIPQSVTPVALPVPATPVACTPRFTITLETRMHSVSLNPFKHIRNHLNANVVTLPVDEKTYDSMRVGKVLDKEFDGMGLALRGSWQSVQTVVVDKQKTCN